MKQICYSNIMLILLLAFILIPSSLAATSIVVNGPSDGLVVKNSKVDFYFGFDSDEAIKNCTLEVDGVVTVFRSSMIRQYNNAIAASLTSGDHDWLLYCYTEKAELIKSDSRRIVVNVTTQVTIGYETIYVSGLRNYEITPFEGQERIVLPEIKSGESIRFKTTKATYYVDILKTGSDPQGDFVEFRDRTSRKIYKLTAKDSVVLEYEQQTPVRVELLLDRVERSVNAFFVIIPYPGEQAQIIEENVTAIVKPDQEPAVETSEQEVAQKSTQQSSGEDEDQTSNLVDETPPSKSTAPATSVKKASTKGFNYTIIIVAVVLALIIAAIVLMKKPAKPTRDNKQKEEQQAASESSGSSIDVIRSTVKKRR